MSLCSATVPGQAMYVLAYFGWKSPELFLIGVLLTDLLSGHFFKMWIHLKTYRISLRVNAQEALIGKNLTFNCELEYTIFNGDYI